MGVWKRQIKRFIMRLNFVCALLSTFLLFVTFSITSHSGRDRKTSLFEPGFEITKSACVRGYLGNMPPVCNRGCLEIIKHSPKNDSWPLTEETKIMFEDSPGWLGVYHVELAHDLAIMQWNHSVFGSVGKVGRYWSKYTYVLAALVDFDVGERLLLTDRSFDIQYRGSFFKAFDKKREIFDKNMQKMGFSFTSFDETRQIRIFNNNSFYLNKGVFMKLNMPAFRFYSIHNMHPFFNIRQAACSLVPGGIIVLDNQNRTVQNTMKKFSYVYGKYILRPFIDTGSKLYLCTYDYCNNYIQFFRERRFAFKYELMLVNNTDFGPNSTYFRYIWI